MVIGKIQLRATSYNNKINTVTIYIVISQIATTSPSANKPQRGWQSGRTDTYMTQRMRCTHVANSGRCNSNKNKNTPQMLARSKKLVLAKKTSQQRACWLFVWQAHTASCYCCCCCSSGCCIGCSTTNNSHHRQQTLINRHAAAATRLQEDVASSKQQATIEIEVMLHCICIAGDVAAERCAAVIICCSSSASNSKNNGRYKCCNDRCIT